MLSPFLVSPRKTPSSLPLPLPAAHQPIHSFLALAFPTLGHRTFTGPRAFDDRLGQPLFYIYDFFFFFGMYQCNPYTHICSAFRGQKRALDCLGLDSSYPWLSAAWWVLGIEPGSSGRAARLGHLSTLPSKNI
jgi:hypothetical protein